MKRWALMLTIGLASPAAAQLLGGGLPAGGLGTPLGGVTDTVQRATGSMLGSRQQASDALSQGVASGLGGPLLMADGALRALSPRDLLALRKERLRALVRENRATLDVDDDGNPVRRDAILALALTPDTLEKAKAAGFTLTRVETIDGLDVSTSILAPPHGKPVRKAIEALRALDPGGTYALDAIYEPAHAPLAAMAGALAGGGGATSGNAPLRMGLIDGGVGRHPAFAGIAIEQRGFAGDAKPSGHGTAVASLMVGRSGAFHGAMPGAGLLVADVYGGSASNGSAVAIVRAMSWLAQNGAKVVNISLVGPPNPLLAAGIRALTTKGIRVVAAVGNDGPAAPPQYPASYPDVIAVTGVDAKGKALMEAGKPLHLDYAAPGADMVGAVPGGGWEVLRGTSFAAPLVAATLARVGTPAALAAEAKPGSGRIGRGILCDTCRTPPKAVGLK
jgi:hypothetical protein